MFYRCNLAMVLWVVAGVIVIFQGEDKEELKRLGNLLKNITWLRRNMFGFEYQSG